MKGPRSGVWGMTRRDGAERGASTVEFAIVASLLFMMVFGMIQFGIAFNRFQGLQAGAREGGRIASLGQSTIGNIKDRVRGSVSMIDVTTSNESCPSPSGVGQYCISINSPRAGLPTAAAAQGCTGSSGSSSCTFQPCDGEQGEVVTVTVAYRTQISIPFVGSPTYTLTGEGLFRCE